MNLQYGRSNILIIGWLQAELEKKLRYYQKLPGKTIRKAHILKEVHFKISLYMSQKQSLK